MFDPSIGRWFGEDPIDFGAGEPNLYRYVGNNPTNATDPSGLQSIWEQLKAAFQGKPETRPSTHKVSGEIRRRHGVPPGVNLTYHISGTVDAKIDVENQELGIKGSIWILASNDLVVSATLNGEPRGPVYKKGIVVTYSGVGAEKVTFLQTIRKSKGYVTLDPMRFGDDNRALLPITDKHTLNTSANFSISNQLADPIHDSRRQKVGTAGYVESGNDGSVGFGSTVFATDFPSVATAFVDGVYAPEYEAKKEIVGLYHTLGFTTYLVVGGKAFAAVDWDSTAATSRDPGTGKFRRLTGRDTVIFRGVRINPAEGLPQSHIDAANAIEDGVLAKWVGASVPQQ